MTAALEVPGVHLTAAHLIALRDLGTAPDGPTGAGTSLGSGFIAKRRGTGQDIEDIRAYVTGDDMRHLDRAATARTGNLHVRTFREERDRVVLLVADFRPSMLWGMRRALCSVAAAEALAYIGWQAVEAGERVGLLAITAREPVLVPARRRVRAMLNVIGGMVEAHQRALSMATQALADPPLDAALSGIARIAPTGSDVLIASSFDTPGDGLEDRLSDLSRRRGIHRIEIADQAITSLPKGDYPLIDASGTRVSVQLRDTPDGSAAPPTGLDAGLPVDQMLRALEGVNG